MSWLEDILLDALGWAWGVIYDLIYAPVSEATLSAATLGSVWSRVYVITQTVINTVTGPVGYTLLGFFFLVAVYEAMTRNNEITSGVKTIELVLTSLIALVGLKIVIDAAPLFMDGLYMIIANITKGIGQAGTSGDVGMGIERDVFITNIRDAVSEDPAAIMPFMVVTLLCMILGIVGWLAVQVMIFARFLELYLYVAFSPIPLSTLASRELADVGKGFLKNFIACCLQGAVLVLVLMFLPAVFGDLFAEGAASATMASAFTGWHGLTMALKVMLFVVVEIAAVMGSSAMTRRLVGLG
jgi:hypothetical protein